MVGRSAGEVKNRRTANAHVGTAAPGCPPGAARQLLVGDCSPARIPPAPHLRV